jgi:hypothetical protein
MREVACVWIAEDSIETMKYHERWEETAAEREKCLVVK